MAKKENPENPIADGDGNVLAFEPPDVWEKLDEGGPNATIYHVRGKTADDPPKEQKKSGKVKVAWNPGGPETYELKPSSRVTVTREPRSHVAIQGDGGPLKGIIGPNVFRPGEEIGVVSHAPLPMIESVAVRASAPQPGGMIAPGLRTPVGPA